jgi:bifunctional DNA-binding transcriptional regulator/antitoxin component of YhaV-PrlF toxin-antitoxin module
MSVNKVAGVVLRTKRQLTLPREICDQLCITAGDVLELSIENSVLVARPRKIKGIESLREIQKAFKTSGVPETEMQLAGTMIRQQVARERYGIKS